MTEQEQKQDEMTLFCSQMTAEYREALLEGVRAGHLTTKLQICSAMLDLLAADISVLVESVEQ